MKLFRHEAEVDQTDHLTQRLFRTGCAIIALGLSAITVDTVYSAVRRPAVPLAARPLSELSDAERITVGRQVDAMAQELVHKMSLQITQDQALGRGNVATGKNGGENFVSITSQDGTRGMTTMLALDGRGKQNPVHTFFYEGYDPIKGTYESFVCLDEVNVDGKKHWRLRDGSGSIEEHSVDAVDTADIPSLGEHGYTPVNFVLERDEIMAVFLAVRNNIVGLPPEGQSSARVAQISPIE